MLHLSILAHLLLKFLDVMFLSLSKGALESGLVYVIFVEHSTSKMNELSASLESVCKPFYITETTSPAANFAAI